MVGTSGSSGLRSRPVTARARSLPAFTCGSDDSMGSIMADTWPPTRSCSAGAAPLYSTMGMSPVRWVSCRNSAELRWPAEPKPLVAKVYLVGLAFRTETNSWTLWAGTWGCTLKISAPWASMLTGAKSLTASNLMSFLYSSGLMEWMEALKYSV